MGQYEGDEEGGDRSLCSLHSRARLLSPALEHRDQSLQGPAPKPIAPQRC